jgi:hypothetical protein
MRRSTPILIHNPPPLWRPLLSHCRALMRDLGAPAILIEGWLRDTPFGPKIIATLDLPPQMGRSHLSSHPAYRLAMRDAAGMVTFTRMVAHGASGISPATAAQAPATAAQANDDVVWQVIVLPAGVVLVARSGEADYGPFLLTETEPDEHRIDLVDRQLTFALESDPPAPGVQAQA